MPTPHCELQNVRKAFGGREIFTGLNLTVEEGEMLALTGPSGSGKSTLLNMIGLLDAPDSGQIRILGATHRSPGPEQQTGTCANTSDICSRTTR